MTKSKIIKWTKEQEELVNRMMKDMEDIGYQKGFDETILENDRIINELIKQKEIEILCLKEVKFKLKGE